MDHPSIDRKRRVLFVVESLSAFDFAASVETALPPVDYDVTIATSFPARPDDYDLVILWCLRRRVPGLSRCRNVMVFHSSDLPDGRGWAPIYYALAEGHRTFTITGILASDTIDAGDVVVKARFAIKPGYTAAFLRKVDTWLTLELARKVLERFPGQIEGRAQQGEGSWRPRRRPDESEIDARRPLIDLMPHLRACEAGFPAFFDYEGTRYHISVAPAAEPAWPDDIVIRFAVDEGGPGR